MSAPRFGYLDRKRRAKVVSLLAAGGIAGLPTDTIYGFHCAVSRGDAVERIRRLKGRRGNEGFIVLAADCAMAAELVARWPGDSRRTLGAIWPAPLTAILPARGARARAASVRGAVAVRVPALRELRELIAALGEPIVSTSVNRTGCSPMTRIAEIAARFPGLEAYVSRRGRPISRPSTVVDFTARPARVVRSGAFRWTFSPGGDEGASAPRRR